MLKINFKEGTYSEYEVGGNVIEIAGDIFTLINTTYKRMKSKNENCAKILKDIILENIELAFKSFEKIEKLAREAEKDAEAKKKECDKDTEEKLKALEKALNEVLSVFEDIEGDDDENLDFFC